MNDVEEHHGYVTDHARIHGYESALSDLVSNTTVVLDLAAGTGILGMLATRAGARRVYSVDRGSIIQLARSLAADNRATQMAFIRADSHELQLPEDVDVIVCDQMGPFGWEAGLLRYVADASRRHLRPGGVACPSTIRFEFAPATNDDVRGVVSDWLGQPAGLDFSAAHSYAANTSYRRRLDADSLLGSTCSSDSLDVATWGDQAIRVIGTSTIERAGSLDAIAGWWVAQLSPHQTLSNGPTRHDSIERDQGLLPLEHAIKVRPGDAVDLGIRVLPAARAVSWKVALRPAGGTAVSDETQQSTLLGDLLSSEDLERARSDRVPILGPSARARLGVLLSVDGRRTIQEIEERCVERCGDLFDNPAAARQFARSVLYEGES